MSLISKIRTLFGSKPAPARVVDPLAEVRYAAGAARRTPQLRTQPARPAPPAGLSPMERYVQGGGTFPSESVAALLAEAERGRRQPGHSPSVGGFYGDRLAAHHGPSRLPWVSSETAGGYGGYGDDEPASTVGADLHNRVDDTYCTPDPSASQPAATSSDSSASSSSDCSSPSSSGGGE